MIYSTANTFKVLSLVLTLLCCEATIIQGNLPNVLQISNFLEHFIKPYIQSLKITPNEPLYRTVFETPVNKAIRNKITELKPFFQDGENILENDKLKLDDRVETTIIKVIPNVKTKKDNTRNGIKTNTTMKHFNLYEDLREKINKYLIKESVSVKTKKRILKTVDVLIRQILGNQCSWKTSDNFGNNKFWFRMRNDGIEMILKAHNLTKHEWEQFKMQCIKLNQEKNVAETLLLFNKFQDLFSKIINDTTKLSKGYKIKCHLADTAENGEIETLRRQGHNKFVENNDIGECKNFKLCSKELKSFMSDFYEAINDTAVSTFRNYAAMYGRDVNSDMSKEKNSPVALIYNISNKVESKISKIFIKETANLKLDKGKNKSKNIKNLRQYVQNIVEHVKKRLDMNLEKYLKSLRAHLLTTIKQDINVNLDIELGNLERDFSARICTAFLTCNAIYWSRRNNDLHSNPNLHIGDGKKSVYVKLQLTLDDKVIEEEKNGVRKMEDLKSANLNSTKIKITRTTKQILILL